MWAVCHSTFSSFETVNNLLYTFFPVLAIPLCRENGIILYLVGHVGTAYTLVTWFLPLFSSVNNTAIEHLCTVLAHLGEETQNLHPYSWAVGRRKMHIVHEKCISICTRTNTVGTYFPAALLTLGNILFPLTTDNSYFLHVLPIYSFCPSYWFGWAF